MVSDRSPVLEVKVHIAATLAITIASSFCDT